MRLRLSWLAALALASCKCGEGGASRQDAVPAESAAAPAAPSSGRASVPDLTPVKLAASDAAETPNFGIGPNGEVVLSWTELVEGGGFALRWARRDEGGWSTPADLARGTDLLVNWADFPALAVAGDGRMVATWLRIKPPEGYGVQWKWSQDGGENWTAPTWLHEHVDGPEYGFVSFAQLGDGAVAVFWLDGRESQGHAGGQMQLRAAEIRSDGAVTDRRQVDDRVCDCCQLSAAATASGPVVVYRDRSAEEVRDISIAGPGKEQRRTVSSDGWTIAGCPVNGPAVATRGDGIAVAWFTAADDEARVRVAFGGTAGDFGRAIDIARGSTTMGRVDIEWLGDDAVVVSQLLRTEDGTADVVVHRVDRSGTVGAPLRVGTTTADNAAGFPRMARVGDRLMWAWTQVGGATRTVRLAEAPVAALRG